MVLAGLASGPPLQPALASLQTVSSGTFVVIKETVYEEVCPYPPWGPPCPVAPPPCPHPPVKVEPSITPRKAFPGKALRLELKIEDCKVRGKMHLELADRTHGKVFFRKSVHLRPGERGTLHFNLWGVGPGEYVLRLKVYAEDCVYERAYRFVVYRAWRPVAMPCCPGACGWGWCWPWWCSYALPRCCDDGRWCRYWLVPGLPYAVCVCYAPVIVGGEVYVDVSVKVVTRVSTVVYVPADGAVEVAEEGGDPEVLVTAAPGGDFIPVRVGKGRPLSEVVRVPLERLADGDLVAKVFFRDGRGNSVMFRVPVGLPREVVEGLLSGALSVRG